MTGVIDYKNGSQLEGVTAHLRAGLATAAPVPDTMNDSGRFNLDIDKSGTVVDMGYHRKDDFQGARASAETRVDAFDLDKTAERIGRELTSASHRYPAYEDHARPLARTLARASPASDTIHEGLSNHRDALNAMSQSIKGMERRLDTSEGQATQVKALSREVGKCGARMGDMHEGLVAQKTVMQTQYAALTDLKRSVKTASCDARGAVVRVDEQARSISMMHDGLNNHKSTITALKSGASQHARELAAVRTSVDRAMDKVNNVHTGLLEQKSTVAGLHSGVMAHKDILKSLQTGVKEGKDAMRYMNGSCGSDKINMTATQMQSMLQKHVGARA